MSAALLPLLVLFVLEGLLRAEGFRHDTAAPFFRFGNPERSYAENDAAGPGVPDPNVFWMMRPGWRSPDGLYHVRQTGFRTPDFEFAKPPDTLRVVCLGDSTTFGMGVAENDCWPRRLELGLRKLRDPRGAEVICLGVPGYSAFQGSIMMENLGRGLNADVYVLGFGAFNDWVPAIGHRDSEQGKRTWWQRLRLVQFVYWVVGSEEDGEADKTAEEVRASLAVLDTRDFEGERRVPPGEFEELLTRMADSATAVGGKVVLIAPGLPAKTIERNPISRRYADAVRAVAREGGHALVDGPQLFRDSKLPDDVLFIDFCHPTSRGNAILADAILAATGSAAD